MKNNKKEVVIEFDLPNFKRDDIKIKLSKNSASILAERKIEKEVERKDFYHKEMSSGNFVYKTTLPNINPKKAKISFKGGVLKIIAPKA